MPPPAAAAMEETKRRSSSHADAVDRHSRREKDSDRHRHRDKDPDHHDRKSDRHRDRRAERDASPDEKPRRPDRESREPRERSPDEKLRRSGRESREPREPRERSPAETPRRSQRNQERGPDVKHRDCKEREREKERERAKEKERAREEREQERVLEKEKERAREERALEKEKEKEKGREHRKREERERDKERDRERRRHEAERDEDDSHDRKRRRCDSSRQRRSDHKVEQEEERERRKKKTRVEDLEEDQQKPDKPRSRVQEWQELRRKEEEEQEKGGGVEQPKSGKNWTLEGESDDDDGKDMVMEGSDSKAVDAGQSNGDVTVAADANGNEEEVDPLDAYMCSILAEAEKLANVDILVQSEESKAECVKAVQKEGLGNGKQSKKKSVKNTVGRILPGEESESDYDDVDNEAAPSEEEEDEDFIKRVKKTKAEKLAIVDHSKIQYPPFRKNFYIEGKEIARMTTDEVVAYRKQLELKIHGKDVPKPIKTWNQTGLTSKILDTIKKMGFEKPMPIQAQAFSVIMSGRDCIGIAKTGSGKTLAFVLPMLRHIKDQPPVVSGEGPIGLIMAPTRELVQQIHSDIKKFAKVMGINCVQVYGGSGVAQQISDLKRGAEIVVCTPGRMIDILCTSAGKITNLRRVTFLVMDEADRMFDMGFEPQITRIVQNTQPGRQTVLFSATFPRQVELLARKVLTKPVEMQVGGRSVVNKDITQLVELRQENDRFNRLLELLGEWYEKGKILVFVHSQDKCDSLFKDLIRHGYPCLSLHGAKDQTDRESTIADFKSNVCNLMTATSIAARGLDVKELELVVNFDAPNHYEDYVHRVGRTGRAGRKGCAVTFISEDDAQYAPDLVKALELSEQAVPADLKALADGFMAKVNQGMEQAHGTGYGGSGFKFNEEEDDARKAAKKAQAREYGFEEDKSDSDSEDDGVRKGGAATTTAARAPASTTTLPGTSTQVLPNGVSIGLPVPAPVTTTQGDPASIRDAVARLLADALPEHYEAELEINDFPQNARWKVTHKETLSPISEWTGAAITTRGQYHPPGKILGPGERKLYLFIEGPSENSVKKAKAEVKRVLEDFTAHNTLPGGASTGRYSVT